MSCDELLTGLVQSALRQGQTPTQGGLRVVAEALGIGHGEQKEIEGTGLMAEPINVVLPDQALIDPAELLGHLSELGQRQGLLAHVGHLLVDALNDREYRRLIVAGVSGWRRCHLVTQVQLGER